MKKYYYAKVSVWGATIPEVKRFESLKERDEFVAKTDYADKISAAEGKGYFAEQ